MGGVVAEGNHQKVLSNESVRNEFTNLSGLYASVSVL